MKVSDIQNYGKNDLSKQFCSLVPNSIPHIADLLYAEMS